MVCFRVDLVLVWGLFRLGLGFLRVEGFLLGVSLGLM